MAIVGFPCEAWVCYPGRMKRGKRPRRPMKIETFFIITFFTAIAVVLIGIYLVYATWEPPH